MRLENDWTDFAYSLFNTFVIVLIRFAAKETLENIKFGNTKSTFLNGIW